MQSITKVKVKSKFNKIMYTKIKYKFKKIFLMLIIIKTP